MFSILSFFATLLLILGAYLTYIVISNKKILNKIKEVGISKAKKENELEELEIGEFKTVYINKILPFK